MTSGDFDSAIAALVKATVPENPIAVSHALLGMVYLRLAMFDMFDRGLCEIDLVDRNSVSEEALSGYLGLQIKELIAPGRPRAYAEALAGKGYDQGDRIAGLASVMLRTFDKRGAFYSDWKKDLNAVLKDLGESRPLAVPTFTVDEHARSILTLASQEFRMAGEGTAVLPSGWTVIRAEEIKAAAKAVKVLLGQTHPGEAGHDLETLVVQVYGGRLVEIGVGSAAGVGVGMIFSVTRAGQEICRIRITNIETARATGTTFGELQQKPNVGDVATAKLIG